MKNNRCSKPPAITYIACPYSHPDAEVRRARFNSVNSFAGKLMAKREIVFSPISQTHPIAEACGLPLDWKYWKRVDTAYLSCCSRLIVLCLPGWRESTGVLAEIKIATELGIEVVYVAANNNRKGERQ